MDIFPITHQGHTVGEADVGIQGLYYRIRCRCEDKSTVSQIVATGERGSVNLGTCVPVPRGMGMNTSVAVKRLGKISGFALIYKDESALQWVPLKNGQPISSLSLIAHAVLMKKDEDFGLSVSG